MRWIREDDGVKGHFVVQVDIEMRESNLDVAVRVGNITFLIRRKSGGMEMG